MKYINIINKNQSFQIIQKFHYSNVLPRITKYYFGLYENDILVGTITLGWGVRPKHTIKKLFPLLDSKDYLEIGKMCLDDNMPKNSETQFLSLIVSWLKNNLPELIYLFTWADGIMGKAGYVYQAFNMKYGGYIWTDCYVSAKGEKIHPRTIQGIIGSNSKNLKYGSRPNDEQRKKLKLSRLKGKQFRYILPLNKKGKKMLKLSFVDWFQKYPKEKDLEWKIKQYNSDNYKYTNIIPIKFQKINDFNKLNINTQPALL